MTDPLAASVPAVELVALLRAKGETVATAESLTAGPLGATPAGGPRAGAGSL